MVAFKSIGVGIATTGFWFNYRKEYKNNSINACLIDPSIYFLFFSWIFLNIFNITIINNIKIIKKINYSSFFMLLTVKSYKPLPKNNEYTFISGPFALSWKMFTPYSSLVNKKLLLPSKCCLKKKHFVSGKRIEYSVSSAVIQSNTSI